MLAAKVEKQINASRASEDIAAYAGQADWQQSLIIERDDASSRSKRKKSRRLFILLSVRIMNAKPRQFYNRVFLIQTQSFICCTRNIIFNMGLVLTVTRPGTLTIYSTFSLHLTIVYMEPVSLSLGQQIDSLQMKAIPFPLSNLKDVFSVSPDENEWFVIDRWDIISSLPFLMGMTPKTLENILEDPSLNNSR